MGDSRGMRKDQGTGLFVPIAFSAFDLLFPHRGVREELALFIFVLHFIMKRSEVSA